MFFDLLVGDTFLTDSVSVAIDSVFSQSMKYYVIEWFRNLGLGELRDHVWARVKNRLFLHKIPLYGSQFAIFLRIIEPSLVERNIH